LAEVNSSVSHPCSPLSELWVSSQSVLSSTTVCLRTFNVLSFLA